jgi:hypothetical protein
VTTAYPLNLRTIIRASKSRSQPAAFRMSQPRRGYGYAEASGTDTPVFWDVTFRFTQAEAQEFRVWFIYTIQRGLLEFELPIRTEFGLLTYTVRFLPESLLNTRENGEVFEYTATIMSRSETVPVDAIRVEGAVAGSNVVALFGFDESPTFTQYSTYSMSMSTTAMTRQAAGGIYGGFAGGFAQANNGTAFSYIELTSTQFNFGTGDFCFEAEVYPIAIKAGYLCWHHNNPISGPAGLVVDMTASGVIRAFQAGGASVIVQTPAPIPVATSTHVAAYRVSGQWAIAINGDVVATATPSPAVNLTATGKFVLGGLNSGSLAANAFVGNMEEVRVCKASPYPIAPFFRPTAIHPRP